MYVFCVMLIAIVTGIGLARISELLDKKYEYIILIIGMLAFYITVSGSK